MVQGDIENEQTQAEVAKLLGQEGADVVCSDAVPDFVGDKFIDHMAAVELNNRVVEFCSSVLNPGGTLIMKII